VRLNIGELGAEQLLGAVARQVLDDVDEFAPAVIALAGIPFGVLVRQHAADRLHHGGAGVVFAGDHLQAVLLAMHFALDGGPDFRILRGKEVHAWHWQVGGWKSRTNILAGAATEPQGARRPPARRLIGQE